MRRRLPPRADRRQPGRPRPVRHEADGGADALPARGARGLCRPLRHQPRDGHLLVLPLQPGYELYPARPHPQGSEVGLRQRLRPAGYHHQSLQAREGPPRDRGGAARAPGRLSRLPALRHERGLRRAHEPPRAAESATDPAAARRAGLVFAVLPLRLLQRALHRAQPRAHPDARRRRRFPAAAGLCDDLPALFPRLQR